MTKARKTIGLLHHVGGGNLGDDATLEAVVCNIRQRWPNAEIVAFSMNPEDTEKRHGIHSGRVRRTGWITGYRHAESETAFKARVKAFGRKYRPLFYLLKATRAAVRLPNEAFRELCFLVPSRRIVKSLDLLIVCGGGQLTERDGPWGFPYTIFKWVALARSAGVRSIFLNVGAGPLTQPLSKYFARRALATADYVSLRDEKSRDLLNRVGFRGKSSVYCDSAYSLELTTVLDRRPPEARSRPIVGFAPMPYPEPPIYPVERHQATYDAFIGKLADFASSLIGQSRALSLFGTDIGVDPGAIADLQTALLNNHGIHPSQYSVSPIKSVHDLLAAMSEVDFFVTCRFHGVIFAHLLNKPVLAIAYHPKVSDLMAELGLSEFCIDIREFDLNLLTDRFASMVGNAEEIKHRMAASLARNRQQLRNQFDDLFRR